MDDTRRTKLPSLAVVVASLALMIAACSGSGEGAGGDVAIDGDTAGGGGAAGTTQPVEVTPVASAGCDTTGVDPVVEAERRIAVDDADRAYLLTVPSGHDGETPLPVVFDFHGLMEGAQVHAAMSDYSSLAEEEGFVVVFGHGTGEPIHWNVSPGATNEDLAYFDAVVDEIGRTLCVDESRIYATGLSNGAMFTSLLICERADVIAAAVPVAGIIDSDGCAPSRPVPTLSYHGTDDPILLFNGGVDVSAIPGSGASPDQSAPTTQPVDLDGDGYPATVGVFAERNGCDPEPTDTEVTAEVIHRAYACPDGAEVEFYIIVGGGHSWPSSEFSRTIVDVVGHTTFDIDATRDSWAFMEQYTTPPGA